MRNLSEKDYYAPFPVPDTAPADGLLCQGGYLDPDVLLYAYSRGIFPWFSDGDPILWWCPDPRYILFPDKFHLPARSWRKLKKFPFVLTINAAFENVIYNCAATRPEGTWLCANMQKAYINLHQLGYAWSVEAWQDQQLAGGLYGVAIGKAFFGESMFHFVSEASRAALWALVDYLKREKYLFIDCQQETGHMSRMGAEPVQRSKFLKMVKEATCHANGTVKLNAPGKTLEPLLYIHENNEWRKDSTLR